MQALSQDLEAVTKMSMESRASGTGMRIFAAQRECEARSCAYIIKCGANNLAWTFFMIIAAKRPKIGRARGLKIC